MDELKRIYVVDEQNHRVAVQIDIETFNRIEETLENFALAKLMKENADDDALSPNEAHSLRQGERLRFSCSKRLPKLTRLAPAEKSSE